MGHTTKVVGGVTAFWNVVKLWSEAPDFKGAQLVVMAVADVDRSVDSCLERMQMFQTKRAGNIHVH
jgi:hypothetical protein